MIPEGKLGERCANCGIWVRCPTCGNIIPDRSAVWSNDCSKIFCASKCQREYEEKHKQ